MKRLTKAILIALGLIVIPAAILLALDLIGTPATAKAAEYYLQAELHSTNAAILINGFSIKAEIAGTVTQPITLFLVNGTNKIDVAYSPGSLRDERSSLTWSILEVPEGETRDIKSAKRLLEGSMGSRVISWPDLSDQDFTVSRGSIDKHHFFFQREGNKVSLEGRLDKSVAFARLPSRLSYGSLAVPVTNASIRFIKSGTPISVTFTGLTLPQGRQTVDLPLASIADGAKWKDESGFDEILITGEAGKTYGPGLALSDLKIAEIPRELKEAHELDLTLPHWHWQNGDRYTALSEKDKAEIWQLTKRYYNAIQQQNFSDMLELIRDKLILYQQYMQLSRKEMEELEQQRFQVLTEDGPIKLEPISQANIRYNLLNPQVVTISTLDDQPVIRSVPQDVGGGKASGRFELFFSHIGGKWVISL